MTPMPTTRLETAPPLMAEPADFSLVLGGPLYQLLRRTRLSDDALTMVHRRIVAGVLITWLPLLLLSAWEDRLWWGVVEVPFLPNVEVHTRFLLALPLLIFAEFGVHLRMRRLLSQFIARALRATADRPRVDAAVASAMRLRNSEPRDSLITRTSASIGRASTSTTPRSTRIFWEPAVASPIRRAAIASRR